MEGYQSIWQKYSKSNSNFSLEEYKDLQLEIAYLRKQLSNQAKVIRQLKEDAYTDSLTKLWNKRKFQEDLEKTVRYNKRHARHSAVFFIDLNHFKPINDSLGHLAGDYLLKHIASTLKENCRDHDDVYRFGGDEFVIIMHNVNPINYQEKSVDINNIIMRSACTYNSKEICISASVGACLIDGNLSSENIVEQADIEMYKVKQQITRMSLVS